MTPPHDAPARQEKAEPSKARVVAELQALALALHIGGLDGLRTGQVQILRTPAALKEEERHG